MSEPFLIAHKVRGEPAFDVAEQMTCPVCKGYSYIASFGYGRGDVGVTVSKTGCDECEGKGFWWIIPTSGHRARPYWAFKISELITKVNDYGEGFGVSTEYVELPPAPEGWPDHFPINNSSTAPTSAQSGADLLEELGL